MTREKASNWDASCIPSQAGKVAIVTGANSGVGFDTALELARRGAHVVLACRNPERGEDAEQRIRQGLADLRPHVEFMRLDLSDLDSVRAFAAAFTAKFDRLDILVNNAGLLLPEQTHTETGLEMQFAVNYLGHFLLTQLLFDVLKRSELPSRVVNVSSAGHRLARLDLATVARATPAKGHGMNEYYCSKLANLLFTYELDRRINAAGLSSRVLSVAAHPGIVESELPQKVAAKFTPKFMTNVVRSVVRHLPILQDTEFGALPVLFAATDSGVQGGAFFGPNGVTTIWGKAPAREKSSSESYSQELAASLWQLGEETAGCTFVVAP